MAHHLIAIDGTGADGRPEGAGTAEACPVTGPGGVRASIERVAVPRSISHFFDDALPDRFRTDSNEKSQVTFVWFVCW